MKTKRRCRCGRPVRRGSKTGTCHRCNTRRTREDLIRGFRLPGASPQARDLDKPIREARIPIYQVRAQKKLPLFQEGQPEHEQDAGPQDQGVDE